MAIVVDKNRLDYRIWALAVYVFSFLLDLRLVQLLWGDGLTTLVERLLNLGLLFLARRIVFTLLRVLNHAEFVVAKARALITCKKTWAQVPVALGILTSLVFEYFCVPRLITIAFFNCVICNFLAWLLFLNAVEVAPNTDTSTMFFKRRIVVV